MKATKKINKRQNKENGHPKEKGQGQKSNKKGTDKREQAGQTPRTGRPQGRQEEKAKKKITTGTRKQ